MAEIKNLEDALKEIERLKKENKEQAEVVESLNQHVSRAEEAKAAGRPVVTIKGKKYHVNSAKVRVSAEDTAILPEGTVENFVLDLRKLAASGHTKFFEKLIENQSGILTLVPVNNK